MGASHVPAWDVPIRRPSAVRSEGLLRAGIVFAMIAVTVLDRFGLRVTEEYSIPPGMVALYVVVAAMLASGAARLEPRGTLAYLAVAAVGGASYVVNASFEPRPFATLNSFLLLFVLYAPFAFALKPGAAGPGLWRWSARLYVAFALVLAVAGCAQFFAQFFVRPQWLFDYTPLIPEGLRNSGGWKTEYSMGGWVKSNGFFLREPSMFSVAMAIGLLCELAVARRKWVLALLGLGLLLSYSGSGLLCLAVALLFPLGARSVLRLALAGALAAGVYLALGDALELSYTVDRVGEIANERSSAYCRFVYPGAAALRELDSQPWASVLGHGPGTMVRMGATCADGHQTTYAKVLFEYGVAGVFAIGLLLAYALRRGAAPVQLRVALLLTWLLLGGNLLDPAVLVLIYVLSAMWPDGEAA